MRFYFPDSQDLVSPTYDFLRDEYSPLRVRQRDDLYAHEVLATAPYDGLLVSKSIVDGSVKGSAKYSEPQRQRLYRLGVRNFFRLPAKMSTLGDCGAFNYVDEDEPPYTPAEVLDFYEGCGFDAGISVDHVILGYERSATLFLADPEWTRRQVISLRMAEAFLEEVQRRRSSVVPVGAAQGWSPESYAHAVDQLQGMGYRRIALGGMVPLKTPDILDCLAAIDNVRDPAVDLHLLGVTRVESMGSFASHGVVSFDSTSPFRQAFKDDRRNYHTIDDAYVAIRVPQVEGNPSLKRAVLSGQVSQREAVAAERDCLKALREYDTGATRIDETLGCLATYEGLTQSRRSYLEDYRRTLEAKPWQSCSCSLCERHGIEIAIFRGTERNKRRGFHNLSVFADRMRAADARRTPHRSAHGPDL
jgi:hypothetical protein